MVYSEGTRHMRHMRVTYVSGTSLQVTVEGQRVCACYVSQTVDEEDIWHALSKRIVKELVTAQVTFQATDIKTISVVETIETGEFHREADLIPMVLLGAAVYRFTRN